MIALLLLENSCDQAAVPFDIVESSTIPPGTGSSAETEVYFSPWRNSYIDGALVGCRLLAVPCKQSGPV